MKLHWQKLLLGIGAGVLLGLLGIGAIIAFVIAFSAAASIADVQALPRYVFMVSIMTGLATAWAAFIATRRQPPHPTLHGALIGLGIGILSWLLIPASFMAHVLVILLALPAGIFGSRLAQLNPSNSSRR